MFSYDESPGTTSCGIDMELAAGQLLELLLRDKLRVERGRSGRDALAAARSSLTADDLLDGVLRRLVGSERPESVRHLLRATKPGLEVAYRDRLLSRSLLYAEASRSRLSPAARTRYRLRDSSTSESLCERVRNAFLEPASIDLRTVALITLLARAGTGSMLFRAACKVARELPDSRPRGWRTMWMASQWPVQRTVETLPGTYMDLAATGHVAATTPGHGQSTVELCEAFYSVTRPLVINA
jgi:hypothetical protein